MSLMLILSGFLNVFLVIQKDYHTDLSQGLAMYFIVFIVDIGILVAIVALFLV